MKPFLILIFSFVIAVFAVRILLHGYDFAFSARIAMSVMLVLLPLPILHFPKEWLSMLPGFIPFKLGIVYLTGIFEMAAAAGLQIAGWRDLTGMLLIIFFILVLPANIYSAIKHIDCQKGTTDGKGPNYLWFRVPLQVFFILWVYFSIK
jgi:uncharacterized membrane protein